ncbi:MAG: 50S ribosomal protein L9 [Actinomycetota bacterium]|nr:50S ribosomal protein L9 [Actinomycetota bacterium]
MKIILTKYHEKLGDVGDEVEVKSGYANNYLIPNGIAVPATRGNINQMKIVKQAAIKVEARNIKEAEELVKKLEDLKVVFVVKTGGEGKLYGSITNKDIAEKISEEKNIDIDRKKIDLQEHIKELGEYDIDLKLYKEIKASVKIKVEPDEESKALIEAYEAEKEKEEKEEAERQKLGESKEEEPEDKDEKEEKPVKEKAKKIKAEEKKEDKKDKTGKD